MRGWMERLRSFQHSTMRLLTRASAPHGPAERPRSRARAIGMSPSRLLARLSLSVTLAFGCCAVACSAEAPAAPLLSVSLPGAPHPLLSLEATVARSDDADHQQWGRHEEPQGEAPGQGQGPGSVEQQEAGWPEHRGSAGRGGRGAHGGEWRAPESPAPAGAGQPAPASGQQGASGVPPAPPSPPEQQSRHGAEGAATVGHERHGREQSARENWGVAHGGHDKTEETPAKAMKDTSSAKSGGSTGAAPASAPSTGTTGSRAAAVPAATPAGTAAATSAAATAAATPTAP